MDCTNARLLLLFATTDGRELADDENEELSAHLLSCPECRAQEREQRRFDLHLGRAMHAVPVPAGLRERLLASVAPAASRAAGAEHGPGKKRRWFRPVGAGLALATAASVCLFIWGWYFWQNHTHETLSAEQVQYCANVTPVRDVDSINEVFHRLGARRCAPRFANYAYLSSDPALAILPGYGQEKVKVPYLIFTNGEQTVRMFIINNRQYRVEDAEHVGQGYAYKVAVHRPSNEAYTYLMLYNVRWDWLCVPGEME